MKINRLKAQLVVGLTTLMLSPLAFAQNTVGDVAENFQGFLGPIADLTTGAMFLVGIGIGAMSLLKFKAYNEDPRQNKITTPITLALVSAGLIGLPAYLTIMKNSLTDGESNDLDGSVYDQIG